jgi:hypothetical protein
MEDGQDKMPFKGVTMQPLKYGGRNRQRHVLNSRIRFATPRSVVERRLKRWMQGTAPAISIPGKIPRMSRNRDFAYHRIRATQGGSSGQKRLNPLLR